MKRKQRITLFGIVAVALILVACDGDSGNNSSVSEEDSSSSVVSSSSLAVLSSSATSQSSSSAPLSSSVVKSSSSSLVVSSSSVTLPSSSSSIKYGSLTYKGQTYKTVVIGTQTWMAENLNYAVDSSWCYNNSADSCTKYGRLYQWASAMDLDPAYDSTAWGGDDVNHQGICPEDWHVPNRDDWQTLYDYVDANNGDDEGVGTSLKSTGEWIPAFKTATGTDRFGFFALPSGYLDIITGDFSHVSDYAYFWSATEDNRNYAHNWSLSYIDEDLLTYSYNDKNYGYSVRCLKNAK